MPITLSRNEFITAYYKYAWEVADITIASTEKKNGPINAAIDVESVKAEGVMAGLDKTFEKYDPEHSSGARVKTLLSKIVRNSVLSELGKATTDAKRARLIATKPSAKKGEEWKYSCITPGVRQQQSSDGLVEDHRYMESVGWQERKEDLLQLLTRHMKNLPDHDMIILTNWLQDESTYVEASLDELGKEHTPANANWVYQRKNKAIKALKKIMGGTKPDYRDISLESAAINANILVTSNFDVIHPDRESAVQEHSSKYNYNDVVTQLIERLEKTS